MKITIDDIPDILRLYDIVRAEIASAGQDAADYTPEDIAKRIIVLWRSNRDQQREKNPAIKHYALILTAEEIECLKTLFRSFRIVGHEPEEIEEKLRELIIEKG